MRRASNLRFSDRPTGKYRRRVCEVQKWCHLLSHTDMASRSRSTKYLFSWNVRSKFNGRRHTSHTYIQTTSTDALLNIIATDTLLCHVFTECARYVTLLAEAEIEDCNTDWGTCTYLYRSYELSSGLGFCTIITANWNAAGRLSPIKHFCKPIIKT
jgi:hypothetical protein